jgi:hypothetical protein
MTRALRCSTLGLTLALGLAGAAGAGEPFRRGIVLADDPLEHEAVISTRGVDKPRWTLFQGTTAPDNHLMAHVDRRSGAVRFEVRQALSYLGPFRDFRQANYETPAQPMVAELRKVEANRAICDGLDQAMTCFEEVSFSVAETDLRRLAAPDATTVEPGRWSFKFKPVLGREHRTSVSTAEIAGLLDAVDQYRRALPSAEAAAPVPTLP